MRSPWQLIKGLVSRSKSDDADETADANMAIPGPRVESSEQQHTAPESEREELAPLPPATTADYDDSDRLSASIGAGTGKSLSAVQTGPLPFQAAENVAPAAADKPAAKALADSTMVGEGDPSTLITRPTKRRAKAVQTRENLSKQLTVKTAAEMPGAGKKTAVDEAEELDREINNLRLHLSAKLLEQNKQLRRMIERYENE
jgi:hypothetical protein